MLKIENIVTTEIFDFKRLGHEELSGIFTPNYNQDYVNQYIHEQFILGAENYHKFYKKHDFFKSIIRRFVNHLNIDVDSPSYILDIGSGSGNSVIPLLQMFPKAHIIATDLSVNLLAILSKEVTDMDLRERVSILQMNAQELNLKPDSIDIVCGAAILHHLFEPEKTIARCAEILKPGGHALFIEPMQMGNYFVRMLYAMALQDPRSDQIPERCRRYFANRIRFFDDRSGIDKSNPKFLKMDDKWMFVRDYLSELVDKYGFKNLSILPIGNAKKVVRTKLDTHFRAVKISFSDLPVWFSQMVDEVDNNIPDKLRREIITEAAIIFTN
ncbi:MAG: class I SAM-dependent methyltransferase [Microcoleaceae cyanobacterium]